MKALFANLTEMDFGRSPRRARTAATRERVYALFADIQLAIHDNHRRKVDGLMVQLAEATVQNAAPMRRDH
jgi:hypothetical protein